jgi:hypothetical protein
VRRSVISVSWTILFCSLLVSLAAIVTPLGLHDGIGLETKSTQVRFQYVKDLSALGEGTGPRLDVGFSRICAGGALACPGTATEVTTTNGSTSVEGTYDIRIPKRTYDFLMSGLKRLAPTVSSTFDIQYRNFLKRNDSGYIFVNPEYFNNGSDYDIGTYRQITTLLINNAWEPVEGLIVDTKDGGVGFRYHSIPSDFLPFGAAWQEDLLFIEPVTECVNLNISLDFTMGGGFSNRHTVNAAIVDHGGFVNIPRIVPAYDGSDEQNSFNLAGRVYRSAWYDLVNLMLLWNVTDRGATVEDFPFSYLNSNLGRVYPLPVRKFDNTSVPNIPTASIKLTSWPSIFNSILSLGNSTLSYLNASDDSYNVPTNPWGITLDHFYDNGSKYRSTNC